MTTTMTKIKAVGGAVLILAFFLAFAAMPAFATGGDHECQGGHNCNEDGNGQAEATSEATATAESTATADATSYSEGGSGGSGGEGGSAHASNEGINVDASDHSRVENNSSNIVLVPNNNTENCLRVFGIAWGKNGESGALGVPWRSGKCDTEAAADDAFAAGERENGWFWKCENKNLYKRFKDKGETAEQASQQCLSKMLGEITAMKTIETLTTQLTTVNNERLIERNKAKESRERLTLACEESKDRLFAACQK